MDCIRCRADVPADARFCPTCGAPQSRLCGNCNVANATSDRFCKGCGRALDVTAEAERRILTIVFCDLVGSVELSAQLDPEDLRELMRAYQQVCEDAIGRFDGHVAQYLGDGVLAYFGYPAAHEDDARRAVLASMEIVQALEPLAAQWRDKRGVELRLRIGVHSGPTVVGEMGRGAGGLPLASGETPNVAARCQALAEPGTVLISGATHTLVRGYFHFERLAAATIKGIERPLPLYRVLSATGALSRLAAAADTDLLPFVGRDAALHAILEHWSTVEQGHGRVVLLRGEAGIGKSRLLQVVQDHVVGQGARHLQAQCSPYHRASAFAPVIAVLESELGLGKGLEASQRADALRAGLDGVKTVDRAETLALISNLLSIDVPGVQQPIGSPQRLRRRTIETLAEYTIALARTTPTLFVFEDLHWADPSTLEFLDELIARASEAPLLLAASSRLDYTPLLKQAEGPAELTLGALDEASARAIVHNAARGQSLPEIVVQRVLVRAEGNPLYLEEITRVVVDAGARADTVIPATVQESLLARIDGLGPAKPIAQLAAAIGRRFSYELLRSMAGVPPAGLNKALDRMVIEEVLIQQGTVPAAQFLFKHALLQDAAYQSLLRVRRREIHAMIARVLADRFPETCEMQPELPARHYTEAELPREAIPLWRQAGERAVARSALVEAASHFASALQLLRALPMDAERAQAELGTLLALGAVLIATKGYSDPQVEQTYGQARELCAAIGDTPQLVPALIGLFGYYMTRADLKVARPLAEQTLAFAQGSDREDSSISHLAYLMHGFAMYQGGAVESARHSFTESARHYRPNRDRANTVAFGQETGMIAQVYLAITLAVSGDSALALHHAQQASAIASEARHPYTSAFCAGARCNLAQLMGDLEATSLHAQYGVDLAREQGFPMWHAFCSVYEGWCAAKRDPGSAVALGHIREGLMMYSAMGMRFYTAYLMGLLATALSGGGQLIEARAMIDEALAYETARDERVFLSDLHRRRAEIRHLLAEPDAQVRDDLRHAVEVARSQQAGLWELRALTSLVALGGDADVYAPACAQLAAVVQRLQPLGDNARLRAAAALLA